MGALKSIKSFASLAKLRRCHFLQTTNILDGDLSPLLVLPNLVEVSFRGRQHYNYKISDMPGYEEPDFYKLKDVLVEKGFSGKEADIILAGVK